MSNQLSQERLYENFRPLQKPWFPLCGTVENYWDRRSVFEDTLNDASLTFQGRDLGLRLGVPHKPLGWGPHIRSHEPMLRWSRTHVLWIMLEFGEVCWTNPGARSSNRCGVRGTGSPTPRSTAVLQGSLDGPELRGFSSETNKRNLRIVRTTEECNRYENIPKRKVKDYYILCFN